jgi:putative ABC transport system permease protein
MRLQNLLQDLRHAGRSLRRSPGHSAIIVATLALGIGVNTAVFSVVNAVMLRPLPYPDADRLAMVFRTVPRLGFARSVASYPDFSDWRERAESFAGMAAYDFHTATYVDAEGAEQWEGYRVTAGLFPLLGGVAVLGRTFTSVEDSPGAAPTILLSHALWRGRFAAATDIVGRTLQLGGEEHVVVGVMPEGFDFPTPGVAYWVPLRGDAARMERDTNFLTVIGRLAAGADVSTAQAELEALAARIDAEAPGANQGYGVFVEARHGFVVRNARAALQVFTAAVAMILAIACANVANLMLVRGTGRRRELAVRAALGAGRLRLAGLLLIESTLLATGGGALGLLLGWGLLRALVALDPDQLPRAAEVGLDGGTLLFTAAVSLGCGVVVGVLPALLGSGTELRRPLASAAARGEPGGWTRRLQQSFVVAQVALAMVLLTGSALLVNSFVRLTAVQPGFDPRNVVAGRVQPPSPAVPTGGTEEEMESFFAGVSTARALFFDQLQERVRALPGVDAVGLTYGLPFGRHSFSRIVVPEGDAVTRGEEPVIGGNVIAGQYLETMRIALTRGRGFTAEDSAKSAPVALVNETLAELFWPQQDAIGKRVRFGDDPDAAWTTVIGVVTDTRVGSLAEDPEPLYYRPLSQAGWPEAMFVAVRSSVPTAEMVTALRDQVRALDRTVPFTDVAAAGDLVRASVAAPRFRTLAFATFGAAAVLLALVGLYGVVAWLAASRRREIGVRIALGADATSIFGMVLRGGVGLTVTGIALGVIAAVALTRFLAGMLYSVAPADPLTFSAVAAALLLVATLACTLPARRAMRADPRESLRSE